MRKFVRLARDRANRSSSGKEVLEVYEGIPPPISDPNEPLDPVPLDSVAPISTEEGPTCSKEDEVLPSVDESDKHFVENIFSLMRKEETFSGQVKLMEWILQIQNSSILYWYLLFEIIRIIVVLEKLALKLILLLCLFIIFSPCPLVLRFLTKGGIMILATWLSQSVVEEQTSVLHVILKVIIHVSSIVCFLQAFYYRTCSWSKRLCWSFQVLCHLPLQKALPVHMSAVLQSVNRLRFYRASGVLLMQMVTESLRTHLILTIWERFTSEIMQLVGANLIIQLHTFKLELSGLYNKKTR